MRCSPCSHDAVGTADELQPLGEERHVIEGHGLAGAEAPLPFAPRGEDHQEEAQEGQDEGDGEELGHQPLTRTRSQSGQEEGRSEEPPAERDGRPGPPSKQAGPGVESLAPLQGGPVLGLVPQGFEPPGLGAPGPRGDFRGRDEVRVRVVPSRPLNLIRVRPEPGRRLDEPALFERRQVFGRRLRGPLQARPVQPHRAEHGLGRLRPRAGR